MPDWFLDYSGFSDLSVYRELIGIFNHLKKHPTSNPLKFAWEDEKNQRIKMLKQFSKSAEYVVVIGYSFPSFNRDIDNAFFQNLSTTTKVYTQGHDYSDSVRIMRYLKQIFPTLDSKFNIQPVESPFFFVPPAYFQDDQNSTPWVAV